MKTYSTTRVKFVVHEGEILALFPDFPWNHYNNNITCYARLGQHGQASKSLMKCKRAKPEEYYSLLIELRSIYENSHDDEIVILKIM